MMMSENEPKWTPGPWTVEVGYRRNDFQNGALPGHKSAFMTIPNVINQRGFVDPNKPLGRANAALVAAAPDLAESVRLFLAYDADTDDDVRMMLNYADARTAARAAYAKARGDS